MLNVATTSSTEEQKDVFLQQLRSATASMHRLLETSDISVNLMKDDTGLNDYISYLQRMQPVIAFYEKEIFPLVQAVVTDIDQRQKSALLQNDLAYLNAPKQHQQPFSPAIDKNDIAFALGYMYVIEGSTLGGRIILKHVQPKFSVTEQNGGAFFAGYQQSTGRLWKHFLHILSTYAIVHEASDRIIEGASHAFQSIYEYFNV